MARKQRPHVEDDERSPGRANDPGEEDLRCHLRKNRWYVDYMSRKDPVLGEAVGDGDLMTILSRKGGAGTALYVVNTRIRTATNEKEASGVDAGEMLRWAEILLWRFDNCPGSIRHASAIVAARVLRRKIEEYTACFKDSLVESELSTASDVLLLLAEAGENARRAAIERARKGLLAHYAKRSSEHTRGGRLRPRRRDTAGSRRGEAERDRTASQR